MSNDVGPQDACQPSRNSLGFTIRILQEMQLEDGQAEDGSAELGCTPEEELSSEDDEDLFPGLLQRVCRMACESSYQGEPL